MTFDLLWQGQIRVPIQNVEKSFSQKCIIDFNTAEIYMYGLSSKLVSQMFVPYKLSVLALGLYSF